MLEAREVKSADEIALLNRAAAMVDGAYHLIHEKLKPGVRENDIVAEVNKFLYTHGSDDVEAINAISGERCNPHPHNFTDRMIRPGDQAFFDILQSFMGYRTCYYRTFNVGRATPAQHDAYKKAREWLDNAIAASSRALDRRHLRVFPKARSSASRTRLSAFGLQFATASASRCTSGRSSRAWCRWITRPRSRKAWCSRSRPTARRPTAIPPRASRKRSWSPTRAAA
jgi:Xaa-Pro dipeptidase